MILRGGAIADLSIMCAHAHAHRRLRHIVLILVTAGMGSACGGTSVDPSPVLLGVWGGNHITMSIAEASTHIELDCAHGDIPSPLSIDAGQKLEAVGTFVREHGGPIRQGEIPDSHPALYTASVTPNEMTLTIQQTDTKEIIGTFTLTRGMEGRVVKCL